MYVYISPAKTSIWKTLNHICIYIAQMYMQVQSKS